MERAKNNKPIIIIIILSLLVIGLGGYIIYDVLLKQDEPSINQNNSNNNEEENEEPISIEITDEMREVINENLSNQNFLVSTNDDQLNINLFESDESRLTITCIMFNEETSYIYSNQQRILNLQEISEKSRMLFGERLNTRILAYEEYNDERFINCLPTGFGIHPFYEVREITYHLEAGIYTMIIDLIYPDDIFSDEDINNLANIAEFQYQANNPEDFLEDAIWKSFIFRREA